MSGSVFGRETDGLQAAKGVCLWVWISTCLWALLLLAIRWAQ